MDGKSGSLCARVTELESDVLLAPSFFGLDGQLPSASHWADGDIRREKGISSHKLSIEAVYTCTSAIKYLRSFFCQMLSSEQISSDNL